MTLDRAAVLEGSEPGAVAIDVQDRASVVAAFRAVEAGGPLQGLVNLAGFTGAKAGVETLDPAVWDEVVGVNLSGAFHVAQAALPLLREGAAGVAGACVERGSLRG